MTIEQTIEIPLDRRLSFEVPPEMPVGMARLILKPIAETHGFLTAQEILDSGLGFGAGPRLDPIEAIKRCSGIAKRHGLTLSSDDFLLISRQDKELENRLDVLE
jgi:hypothetical protein